MSESSEGSIEPMDTDGQADIPEQSEQLTQGQPSDTLVDRGVDDVLDEGYSPPEKWSSAERFGNTLAEQREGESFEERLRQEEPEDQPLFGVDPEESDLDLVPEDDVLDDGEVGDERAGRLVDLTEGVDLTDRVGLEESDLLGDEVGISGAGASAEEAAVHIIDDNRL